jgi:hypothetical protein
VTADRALEQNDGICPPLSNKQGPQENRGLRRFVTGVRELILRLCFLKSNL